MTFQVVSSTCEQIITEVTYHGNLNFQFHIATFTLNLTSLLGRVIYIRLLTILKENMFGEQRNLGNSVSKELHCLCVCVICGCRI